MRTTVAILDKCGGNAVSSVISVLAKTYPEGKVDFGLATSAGIETAKNAVSICKQKLNSSVAVGSASTMPEHDNLQILHDSGCSNCL